MHYTLADYLIDIIENSIQASATAIEVQLFEDVEKIRCLISDNGKGMSEATLQKALDPFYTEEGKHPGRRFGFGLSFLSQAVSAAGGSFTIESTLGKGTTIRFDMDRHNVDTPPLGDVCGVILTAITYEGDYDLVFTRGIGTESFEIRRSELREVLGNMDSVADIALAREYLESQENDLKEKINL